MSRQVKYLSLNNKMKALTFDFIALIRPLRYTICISPIFPHDENKENIHSIVGAGRWAH